MDRKSLIFVLVIAVLALVAIAAIGSAGSEKEKDVPQTPEVPDVPTTPVVPDTPTVPEERHTESVVLDRAYMTMPIGQTLKVEATVTPSDSVDRAEWSTSDRMVATVSQGGYVTARSEGTATITVESGGHSASLQVTVYKGVTQGERNAERSAKAYVAVMSFSEKGLYEQLLYERFSDAEARYGVEHCGADWYAEAQESARGYLDAMSFSKEELYEQLLYEGFTEDQARKAVDEVYV